MSDKTFYVTTPIYYVNARPHIGHAYTTIVADVLARRHRLLGDDTFFLTGTDEHGQKIERSAAAAGIPPQQFADQVSKSFENLWKRMGILRDIGDPLYQQDYIRTTDPRHIRGVQNLFSTLYERGFIELKAYTGTYCVSDEAFVDAPVGTPCPDCGRRLEEVTEENFFFKLSGFQSELIHRIESDDPDYRIIITPESRKNEVLSFLRGDAVSLVADNLPIVHDETLRELANRATRALTEESNNPVVERLIEKNQLGQINGKWYVPGALKDLSISRSSFTWGIPVPEAIQAKENTAQKHVIYVWLDALANYMTALGYGSDDETLFQKFWPAKLHLVGKEIIRFHCVYWPAFLLAAGLPLPKAITAHGWLLFEDSKMSKSKGNIVRTETILDVLGDEAYGKQFPESAKAERDLFASDVLRYFLLREIPFGQDGSFSFDALITRYNADLANGYGNLVSRTLSMLQKYSNGIIADEPPEQSLSEILADLEDFSPKYDANEIRALMESLPSIAAEFIDKNDFAIALNTTATMIATTDRLLTGLTPWKMDPQNVEEWRGIQQSLYVAAESIRIVTVLLYPILPYATAKVWAQLGLGDIEAAARNGELNNLEWGGLKPGTKLGPLGPIFPRADKGLAQIMTDMENPTPVDKEPVDPAAVPHTPTSDPAAAPRTTTLPDPAAALPVGGSTALTTGPDPAKPSPVPADPSAPAPVETTPQITIDDFAKVELRVAQILVAERIPKADKLLRLEVDLGPDFPKRQILSGIAEWYAPEELIGRRIVVITNLAPRKMRGLESHGMLLAASHGENGKPVLATFGEDIALGSRLK